MSFVEAMVQSFAFFRIEVTLTRPIVYVNIMQPWKPHCGGRCLHQRWCHVSRCCTKRCFHGKFDDGVAPSPLTRGGQRVMQSPAAQSHSFHDYYN